MAGTYYEEREVSGWRCEERRLEPEAWNVRCTRDDAVVRFGYGT